jgi:hypothetical protein
MLGKLKRLSCFDYYEYFRNGQLNTLASILHLLWRSQRPIKYTRKYIAPIVTFLTAN